MASPGILAISGTPFGDVPLTDKPFLTPILCNALRAAVRSTAVSQACYDKRACTPPHDTDLPFLTSDVNTAAR